MSLRHTTNDENTFRRSPKGRRGALGGLFSRESLRLRFKKYIYGGESFNIELS